MKGNSIKYKVGDMIHLLLETAIKGQEITDEDIRHIVGEKAYFKIKKIIENYRNSDKFLKWLKFFSKYTNNKNWEVYLELQIGDIRPDVVAINNKRRKIVIVDIKTGERNRRKYMKAVLQLCKYYREFKNIYKGYSIAVYIFWAKEGLFENVNCAVSEVNAYVDRLVSKTLGEYAEQLTEVTYNLTLFTHKLKVEGVATSVQQ